MPQSGQSEIKREDTPSACGDRIAETDNHFVPMATGTTPNHCVSPCSEVGSPPPSTELFTVTRQDTPDISEGSNGISTLSINPHSTDTICADAPTDQPCSEVSKAVDHGRLPLNESLGISGLTIIFGGSMLILVAVAILTLLWFGGGSSPEASHALWAWRNLVLLGWTPQSITLVSLAIRTIVAAQAAVCTSMLAVILIEKRFIRRSQVAQLSILRGINDGPLSLLRLLISSKCIKLFTHVDSVVMCILLLGGTALQFSSTILLLDVQNTGVTSATSPVLTQSLYNPAQQLRSSIAHYYMKQQPVFAGFGESRTNSAVIPNAYGFSDTGLTERAFLPFRLPVDRTTLRYYEGQASTFKSRASCMRPDLDLFQYRTDYWEEWEGDYWAVFNGTVDYVASLLSSGQQPYDSTDCPPLSFRCEVPGVRDGFGWQSSLCLVNGVCGTLGSYDKGSETGLADPWSVNSTIYLLITTNITTEEWQSIDESGATKDNPAIVEATADHGEWRSYAVGPGRFVNVSLCFHNFNVDHTYVNMKARGIVTEPQVTYSPQDGAPETSIVRAHLGADSSRNEYGERGILQLTRLPVPLGDNIITKQDEDRKLARNFTVSQLVSLIWGELIGGMEANTTLMICGHCIGAGQSLHQEITSVLEDIVNFTGRAVDVIQAYVTIISSSIYYDYQKTFVTSEEPQVSSVRTVLTANNCKRRNNCTGFSFVVALLLVHMTCVGIITVLYVRQTRFSRYGNIWHAVSQLTSEELSDVLDASKDQVDKVVRAGMAKEEKVYMVKVGRSPSTNKVEILRQG
ncbi:hypothetical protein EKO27_g6238 [Xylaria grammica]|uniref:Uncharacterized protein n=1 Tax=Xylaria grammica TaxID=363999 RepID=A0A439D3F8_9PEZI|nr:hypothetical protein EKO27_g6238 [Xylaria grammica]